MKNVNLFPYRQQHQWQMTRAFQRAVLLTAGVSLALSLVLAWAMSEGLHWPGQDKDTQASAQKAHAEQQVLVEKMYAYIESTQALHHERQQRLLVLNLIRHLADQPLPGVWIKHLHWVDGALQVDAWVHSDEQAQAWVQRLQGLRGVVGVEKMDTPNDPLAQEMSMSRLHLKLKLGGADEQP